MRVCNEEEQPQEDQLYPSFIWASDFEYFLWKLSVGNGLWCHTSLRRRKHPVAPRQRAVICALFIWIKVLCCCSAIRLLSLRCLEKMDLMAVDGKTSKHLSSSADKTGHKVARLHRRIRKPIYATWEKLKSCFGKLKLLHR